MFYNIKQQSAIQKKKNQTNMFLRIIKIMVEVLSSFSLVRGLKFSYVNLSLICRMFFGIS